MFEFYLDDFMAMVIIVVVERSTQLCFTPSRNDSDDLLVIVSLVRDLLMQYICFLSC